MASPSSALLTLELHKAERLVDAALSRMLQARTMQEVQSLLRVPLPPLLRGLRPPLRSLSRLQAAADRRVQQLVDQDLAALQQLPSDEACRVQLDRLRSGAWAVLRGALGHQYARAIREGERILRSKALESGVPSDVSAGDLPGEPPGA